jgi:hypothetical protein
MSDDVGEVQNSGIDSGIDSGLAVPVLIPGPRGGALWTGGIPGNKGGTGRPPSALRQLARELYGEYLEPTTRKIMDSENPLDMKTKVQVLDHYAKFGLGEVQAVADDTVLKAVGTILANYLPEDVLQQVFAEIEAAVKESV